MEQNKIIEGNKLIAEFMGCYGSTVYWGDQEVYRYGFKDTHITERWHESRFSEETPYHSSWDWLMPVVDKIELLGHKCEIGVSSCTFYSSGYNVERMYADTKIKAVWLAVVDFIEWHNEVIKAR